MTEQQFFEARDIWQTQVPYSEPDIVTPVVAAVTYTMLHAAVWRIQSSLTANIEVISA